LSCRPKRKDLITKQPTCRQKLLLIYGLLEKRGDKRVDANYVRYYAAQIKD
jgi:hypothetical protein